MSTQSIQPVTTSQPTITDQPPLPDLTVLAVPDGYKLLIKARGKGFQIYRSNPQTPGGFDPPRPEAILETDDGKRFHHFKGLKGPTWQDLNDGSAVAGEDKVSAPAPAEHAIPWLRLAAAPAPESTADGTLSDVAYIHRVKTKGGNPPSTDYGPPPAGTETPVPYEAEYRFYVPRG